MTTFKHSNLWPRNGLIILAITSVLLYPFVALAIVECTDPAVLETEIYCSNVTQTSGADDCDSDGYTNYQECAGFTAGNKHIYGFSEDITGVVDAIQLNPAEPDLLFLANISTQGGLMDVAISSAPFQNPLSFYANDFNINTQRVTAEYTSEGRLITGTTRAAVIGENISGIADGEELGWTIVGATNNKLTASQIYTVRIAEDVIEKCDGQCCIIKADRKTTLVDNANCVKNSIDANKPVLNFYILQVIAHEMGHGSRLAPTDKAANYHYDSSSTVMDPAVVYKRGTYYIPNHFNLALDKPELTLYDPAIAN